MKKKVLAYVHTHWDKEWYREFEIFRLRLLRVFDEVLEMLDNGHLPYFYFDGQVCALLEYLEMRPEKETLVRKLIKAKKLFIGPFYTLIDEFLCDEICFQKNLEIGLKISRDFGCEDFIAYFADTFGHSKNTIPILKEFGIDKCMVWRGVPKDTPSEFIFNGINTVNMVRGYFMDIFSTKLSIEEKAEFLNKELNLIAEKSGDTLLLAIGGDHLGIEKDLAEQVNQVNEKLTNYELILSNPFEYFNKVKNNFKHQHNDELRDNSSTFILSGCYSARRDLKQLFSECSYKLKLADDFQKANGEKYSNSIEYAYKLLLQNLAHDGICGCSTDDTHKENTIRYKKVLQIADTIIKELKNQGCKLDLNSNIKEFKDTKIHDNAQVINTLEGFSDEILYNISRVPITEDYTTIYTQIKEVIPTDDEIFVSDTELKNKHISITVTNNGLNIKNKELELNNFIEFIRCDDMGDTYNFAPDINTKEEIAQIISSEVLEQGKFRSGLLIKTNFFDIKVYLYKNSELLNFKIDWNNNLKNKLWQVKFNLENSIKETYSNDKGQLIKRNFDSNYDLKNSLPKTKGIEAKTNFAPMQNYVWADNLAIATKGLTEYMIYKNSIYLTILRSCGIISTPKNPARTTPAGPPIKLYDAQLLGHNSVEFSVSLSKKDDFKNILNEIYPILC